MTHAQIKQSRAAGNSNWEILQQMIDQGSTYKHAAYEIACALRMDEEERQSMAADYVECC